MKLYSKPIGITKDAITSIHQFLNRRINMKLNRPYFYIVMFAVLVIFLVGLDYKNQGSLEWFSNITLSAVITLFYIIFTDKYYKKT